jgi:uncharacterized GH25 family protein
MDMSCMHLPLSLARATALAGVLAGPLGVPAFAHEFWIEPEAHQVEVGETVRSELFVGGMLSGEAYPYLSDQIVAAQLHAPGGVLDIEGMEGDLPALTVTPTEPGLHAIVYHAAPAYIEYDEFETFVNYLAYEGLDDVVRLHKERGLPQAGFSEAYIRNARALLQVGPVDPADVDQPTVMPLELVALQNPFIEGLSELDVQLLWQGAPVPNRQVSIFHRAEDAEAADAVTRSLVVTDSDGQVTIPLGPGGFYLLNAVQMKPASGDDGFVWESHWATLTFAVGGP